MSMLAILDYICHSCLLCERQITMCVFVYRSMLTNAIKRISATLALPGYSVAKN